MAKFKMNSSGLLVPSSSIPSAPAGGHSSKPADHYNFDKMAVFARNGFVIVERSDPTGAEDDFRQWTPDEAREKLRTTNEELENTPTELKYRADVKEMQSRIRRFLDRLDTAIKRAEEQGPYTDASMRRARVRALPKSVYMSQSASKKQAKDD